MPQHSARQWPRQREKELHRPHRRAPGLRRVRGQRGPLRLQMRTYVDAVGHLVVIGIRSGEPIGRDQASYPGDPGQDPGDPLDRPAVDGRLEHHWSPRLPGREQTDPVHLHMVRMPVAPVRVVDRQRVGVLLAEQVSQPPRRDCRIERREGPLGWLSLRPRVGIAEDHDTRRAHRSCRRFQLGVALFGKLVPMEIRSQAGLAESGGHQYDSVSFRAGTR